jgi:hypothetical protein
MLPSCFYFDVFLKLPECQAGTRTAGHASGSIWAADVPGWITAIATAGLLIGAIITAIYAARAFGKQAEGFAILKEQSQREAEQRKIAQASQVFIWTGTTQTPYIEGAVRSIAPAVAIIAHLKNTSPQPVYDVHIVWRKLETAWDQPDFIGPVLLPGQEEDRQRLIDPNYPGQENLAQFGAVAHFRDATGWHWRANTDGPPTDIEEEWEEG